MLTNSTFNREVIRKIALALGEMNERVIFVGGATIGLYINDPAAADVRATKDVDITVEIASLGELESIREELIQKGFKQTPEDDVMSTKAVGWGRPIRGSHKDLLKEKC